jgi:hypothetical protein
VAQGGTPAGTPEISTIPKREALESVPVCGGDTLTQRFDKLFISAHACLLHDTDTVTHPYTIPLIRKKKKLTYK